MNTNTGKSMIKVLVSYNKNMIVIYRTLFLIMLNDNYTQKAYITLANYITLIIFVFCAMFNNNLQQYILAEGKVTV